MASGKIGLCHKTSILETLTEELCDAVTGEKNARRIIDELLDENGFLTAVDEEKQQYRYHYYTGFLAAAKRLGITDGIGNNLYAPDREITRQEMFTLLYNTLKGIGELPSGTGGKPASEYSDAGSVASWAAEAAEVLPAAGANLCTVDFGRIVDFRNDSFLLFRTSSWAFLIDPSVPKAASVSIVFAPKASIILRRSTETASLMTITTEYPFTAPIIARPIPVFPEVGSMMVLPGVSDPQSSACSIIFKAIRSFMLPVGLKPSIFAYSGI
ncbi:MAG TPA: S-layer homology domain-containing protein [Anaerovoracaceae bacterium]|nr:S-layer homology domain-containing protein [Anaerovoracaceae bacterium]